MIAIAAGVVFGLVAPDTAEKAKWLAEAFIQVIQAITGPVIFVTVVIAGQRLQRGARRCGALRRRGADHEAGGAEEGGLVGFITESLLPGSFVEPFVENEILRILGLGIITAAAISFSPTASASASSPSSR